MQPTLFAAAQWTVSSLTRYIRDALEGDARLQEVWVEGEISNASRPASGHLYFTLKDAGAALRCVMWRSSVARLELVIRDGMAVAAHGRIAVYEAGGQYQLSVDRITLSGEGALYQEFLRLKAELEAEGLFSPERKQPLPDFAQRIGIVTSASGAALRDILNTLQRRMPMALALLAPAAVQGAEAPAQLMRALEQLNALRPKPDVILLVRGGGSIEDLWAFNDPALVRAIADSAIPVISGVGHETDFTLSDFAADVRAPTPTAAAELATPITITELKHRLDQTAGNLSAAVQAALAGSRQDLADALNQLDYASPARRIESDRQRLDEVSHRVLSSQAHLLAMHASGLEGWSKRLFALSPMEVLRRGYAVVTRKSDGTLIRRAAEAQGSIQVRVSDGAFEAEVANRDAP